MKLSIIIPFLASQNPVALNALVDGFIFRNSNDFQIIIANYRSAGSSGASLDALAAKDERIKIQRHMYDDIGAALISAINIADGEYILIEDILDFSDFHESGNVLTENYADQIISLIENSGADILLLQNHDNFEKPRDEILVSLSAKIPYILRDKVFKKELITSDAPNFIDEAVWEKAVLGVLLIMRAQTFAASPEPAIRRRPNPQNFLLSDFDKYMGALIKLSGLTESAHSGNEAVMRQWMCEIYLKALYPLYFRLSSEKRRAHKNAMKDFAWLLSAPKIRDARLAAVVVFFGIFPASVIFFCFFWTKEKLEKLEKFLRFINQK